MFCAKLGQKFICKIQLDNMKNKIINLSIAGVLTLSFVSCGPSAEEKARQEAEIQARVEALAKQRADSIAQVEAEQKRLAEEEQRRQEEERIRQEEEQRRQEEEQQRLALEEERKLNGIWAEGKSIDDSHTYGEDKYGNWLPLLHGYKIDIATKMFYSIDIFHTGIKTLQTTTYSYQNGVIKLERWNNECVFNPKNMTITNSVGQVFTKYY